jgi:signal peptidase II
MNAAARSTSSELVRRYMPFALISAVVVVLDQVTKIAVLRHMPLYQSITVIPGFFNLTHIHNPGGAFGFMARHDSPWRHWLFLAAAAVALVMIIYFYHQTPPDRRLFGAALALIFGGAVGNLIDRLRYGVVVDFLDFYIGNLHWPTFNIADSAVTVGVIVFILHILFKKAPI